MKHGAPGKRRDVLAHRLAYCASKDLDLSDIDGQVVCHSCDTPPCVEPQHLFLGTQADNMEDMAAKGRSTLGSRNPNRKLVESDVLAIRKMRREGLTLKVISSVFGVNQASVSMICNRKTWNHV